MLVEIYELCSFSIYNFTLNIYQYIFLSAIPSVCWFFCESLQDIMKHVAFYLFCIVPRNYFCVFGHMIILSLCVTGVYIFFCYISSLVVPSQTKYSKNTDYIWSLVAFASVKMVSQLNVNRKWMLLVQSSKRIACVLHVCPRSHF